MAMPDNVLSSGVFKKPYQYPDSIETGDTVAFELGGIALNDPSQGLQVQVWKAEILNDTIYLSAENIGRIPKYSGLGLTEVDLAFDQNMRPFLAFVESGVAKFLWWDTAISEEVVTQLPENAITPRCCLDDKREWQTLQSDIILAYVIDDRLLMRMQRDRYTVEYELYTGLNAKLHKVGMNIINRLQFQLIPNLITS